MKKKPIDSVDFLLKLAQHTRESGVSWSRGYSLDSKLLEFAQRNKILTYRESREIIKKNTKAKKLGRSFTLEAKGALTLPINHTWVTSTLEEPIVYPVSYIKGTETSFKKEMEALLQVDPQTKQAYMEFREASLSASQASEPIAKWIDSLYYEGSLEQKITTYKNLLTKKKTNRASISKNLLNNFIEPKKADQIIQEGESPSLTTGEREALQFLLWKANNLNEEEKTIKKDFFLEGREEDIRKDGLLVVFEEQEGLKKGYGEGISFSGYHYGKQKASMKSLLEKKRKLLMTNDKGNLELSISLIDKLEVNFTPTGKTEKKKYIVARIPEKVLSFHGSYTSFPADHFAILRRTPPTSTPDKTETRFFDILYSEKPYKKTQKRVVRRIKKKFLDLVGGAEVSEHRHKERLSNRIESVYFPKAVNMGLLKGFSEELNREGEAVYVFEYENPKKTEKLLEGKLN